MKLRLSTTFAGKQKKLAKKGVGEGRRRKRQFRPAPLTFFIFFLLAFAFWLLNRMQTPLSRELKIPISLEQLPPAYTVSSPSRPDTVILLVKDNGFKHLRYDMNDFAPIVLPLRYNKKNKPYFALSKDELRQEIATRLSPTAVIQRQSVESIHLNLEARQQRRLALKLDGLIASANGYVIMKQELVPDSILVYGDRSLLSGLESIKTETYKNLEVKGALSKSLLLRLPDGVDSPTKRADVKVEVEELTEQVFTCPIRLLNVPKWTNLIALPSSVVVRVTLPRSFHRKLREADIIPVIDYNVIQEAEDRDLTDLTVTLADCPSFIQSFSIEPKTVQFVLEKK